MNDLTTGERRTTVQEVAAQLGCNPETVKKHIRELWPDLMRNGISTYLTETQATVILESIKKSTAEHRGIESVDLQRSVAGIETSKSRLFRLQVLQTQMREIYEAELADLRQENNRLQIRLSEAEAWWSVKRVLIETGREYPWKPLRDASRRMGREVQKVFDKNYGEVNAYHIVVWNRVFGLELYEEAPE
jgi:DNA-binding transcriptional regulator YhcF (GntR family)